MKHYWLVLPFVWLLVACGGKDTPNYVIEEKTMEDLLVDIHIAEAVIETNNISRIPEKKQIRAALLLCHGVTQEQFDTTLVWYGYHLTEYMEMYDRVIARLKTENEMTKNLLAQENSRQMTLAGDSIDVWPLSRYHIFDTRLSTNLLAFEITPDENFQRRDYFELRFKVELLPRQSITPQVYMTATYVNNDAVFNQRDIRRDGWYSLALQTDSVKKMKQLKGYIVLPMQAVHERMYIDSISLVRHHYDEQIPEVKRQKNLSWKKEPLRLRTFEGGR